MINTQYVRVSLTKKHTHTETLTNREHLSENRCQINSTVFVFATGWLVWCFFFLFFVVIVFFILSVRLAAITIDTCKILSFNYFIRFSHGFFVCVRVRVRVFVPVFCNHKMNARDIQHRQIAEISYFVVVFVVAVKAIRLPPMKILSS